MYTLLHITMFISTFTGAMDGVVSSLSPAQFMKFDMDNKIIMSVTLPKFTKNDYLQTYKIMPRALVTYFFSIVLDNITNRTKVFQ